MNSILKIALVSLISFTVTACGGGKKTVDPVAVEDITRPPQTISGQRQEVKERDPDEVISFDEWRRQRLEEQRRQQQEDQDK